MSLRVAHEGTGNTDTRGRILAESVQWKSDHLDLEAVGPETGQ